MARLSALGSFLALLLVAGCASTGVYRADGDLPPVLPSEQVAFTVFLTGNTADFDTDAVLSRIGLEAGAAGENSAVVLLGDLEGAESVAALASALRGYSGRVVAVPGDRDSRDVADQLEDALGLEVEGPKRADGELNEIDLTETLRLVALDTPWWLNGAETADAWHPADAATELERLVLDRDDEQLIIVGHHPIESNGRYGGGRTFFGGLTTLGLAPLLSPTVGVSGQDLASPTYRRFTQALASSFGNHERLVYAGASDHSLQSFTRAVNGGRGAQTLLVSGTGGGDISAAQGGYGAQFIAPKPGFWRLTYCADGSLWSEAVVLEGGQATVLYRDELSEADAELSAALAPPPQVTGPVDMPSAPVTQPLDAGFDSGSFRNDGLTRFFAGSGYRDVWKTPVGLEVLDLGTLGGGLTPLRASGGNQTTGLRLQGEDGHVYEVRLIEKGGTGGLPEPLRDGFAGDLVLDLRSAALPYAAVVAADLASSAGLYAPQPRVLFVPDDPRLGVYRETFGGKVALVEVRPDDDMSDLEGWAEVTDVISPGKLREELADDQDHRVDQRSFFRARLLDLMVADWDRHSGQWRWAAFEPGELDPTLEGDATTKGKVYLPVPRDRDWAFYDLGGVAQRALFQFDRRYQPYDEGYGSILGLTANARGQDRRFMSEITRDDALAIADDLSARLTDAAIDRAIGKLPMEIRAEVGDEWRAGLVQRRDDLEYAAGRLYELAAQTVDVVGSDERERFSAVPSADGGVTVTVESFKGGEAGLELYRRTFLPGETNEVRLYGRGGRDQFDIAPGADVVAIRVIGGGGLDQVSSGESDVALYDTPDGLEVEGPVDDRRSDDPGVNRYSEDERIVPLYVSAPIVGARATDGVILGGAVTKTSYGFRMRPYASQQTIAADVATATWGVRASYDGHFVDAVGPFDARVGLSGSLPRNVRNFYGLGNETSFAENDFVQLNLARVQADLGLEVGLGPGALVSLGPTIRYADPSRDDTLFDGPLAGLPDAAYEAQSHAGGVGRVEFSTVDTPGNPKQGVRLVLEGAALAGIGGEAAPYGTVGGTLATFIPVKLAPQFTLALRAGGSHRIGEFPFFDAAVIGQSTSVRGFRRERFAGRSAAFGNAEVRLKLFELPTYLVPFDVGVLGFADAGRVWISPGSDVAGIENPRVLDGDKIHLGYGGGLWFGVLDRAALVLTAQVSEEETLASFGVGFHF